MSNKPETTIRTKNTVLQVAEPFNEVEQKTLKASEKRVPFITLHSADDNVPIMINIHTITLVYPARQSISPDFFFPRFNKVYLFQYKIRRPGHFCPGRLSFCRIIHLF